MEGRIGRNIRAERRFMAQLIKGKDVADRLNAALSERVRRLKDKGIRPCLHVIRIGEKPGDISYEKGASARCEKIGVLCRKTQLPEDVSQEDLIALLKHLSQDDSVHGVLLLRPLPKSMDEHAVVNCLCPEKDVDGMTDLSMSSLITSGNQGYAPCTAEAAMECLDYSKIDCTGKRAVVIGRSRVFGKPAALMLTDRNATVTVCHTKTVDLPAIVREADIVLTATGHPGTVDKACVRKGQIVIDVGISMGPDHKLCGDVIFEEAEPVVAAITPVPGGVGAVTTSILVKHVVEACERSACQSNS